MIGCFVTGTDTGVGKTLAASALLHALARRHARVVGMKPVAAGCDRAGGVWTNEDVLALRAASTIEAPPELQNPILLADAVSPHIAAERAGVGIDIGHLVACYCALSRRAEAVVVEGAGGFHVPLSRETTGADLAQALALPVVLVVGLRLGCLSHALLTADAIRARGLKLAGWVANRIDAEMQAQEDNIALLRHKLPAPLLGDFPHLSRPDARSVTLLLPPEWT
ncbi:MAG: dethiobiotin synthase [Ramlibacter sp.]|jgi:dethiobiotin synthetase|nr:dethiobiotin synthase [Ramlibacter sp.]